MVTVGETYVRQSMVGHRKIHFQTFSFSKSQIPSSFNVSNIVFCAELFSKSFVLSLILYQQSATRYNLVCIEKLSLSKKS